MKTINVADDILIAIDNIVDGSNADGEEMTARQREQATIKRMLSSLVGEVNISHNKVGKPELEGYEISFSHTISKKDGYAAVMLSKTHKVGIDIEYQSPRIMKIADRFLRSDECPQSVDDHLVCWCAKEAVYKLFSSEDLTYQQMRVSADMNKVENLKDGSSVSIHKIINDKFVLVYCFI